MAKDRYRRRSRGRQRMRGDFGRIAAGLATVASALSHGSGTGASEGMQELVRSLEKTGKDLRRAARDANVGEWGRSASSMVGRLGERPVTTALIAFGVGVVVGAMLTGDHEDEEDDEDEEDNEDED